MHPSSHTRLSWNEHSFTHRVKVVRIVNTNAALPPPSPKLDPPHYHPVHPDSGRPKRARARRYPRVILSLDAARWSYQEGRVGCGRLEPACTVHSPCRGGVMRGERACGSRACLAPGASAGAGHRCTRGPHTPRRDVLVPVSQCTHLRLTPRDWAWSCAMSRSAHA
ncbi:hypothetical protein B0H13DRAFT_2099544 [Mycena leptocephala]|nr:hypothetical protein B0H13DRAFT_2099544 [Mycena leptocephala]